MLNWNELKTVAVKVAEDAKPGMMDRAKALGNDALDLGKEYGPAMGYGAAGGAIAGIPVALLAHALMAKNENRGLRNYLKSGLLGALLGGGLGAAGGAGLRGFAQSSPERGKSVGDAINYAKDKAIGLGVDAFDSDGASLADSGADKLKEILGIN